MTNIYDPDLTMCVCDHVRVGHEADADFNGERYVMEWGRCRGESEPDTDGNVVACGCERFEEKWRDAK